jgi:hypothetical protein
VVVHIAQPLLLAAIVLLLSSLIKHPWLVIFLVLAGLYVGYLFAKREMQSRKNKVSLVSNEEPLPRRSTTRTSPHLSQFKDGPKESASKGIMSELRAIASKSNQVESSVVVAGGSLEGCILGDADKDEDSCSIDIRPADSAGAAKANRHGDDDNDDDERGPKKKNVPFMFRLFSLQSFMSDQDGEDYFPAIKEANSDDSDSSGDESFVRPAYRGMYSLAESDGDSSDEDIRRAAATTQERVVRKPHTDRIPAVNEGAERSRRKSSVQRFQRNVRSLSDDDSSQSDDEAAAPDATATARKIKKEKKAAENEHRPYVAEAVDSSRRPSRFQQMFELEAENCSDSAEASRVRGDVSIAIEPAADDDRSRSHTSEGLATRFRKLLSRGLSNSE